MNKLKIHIISVFILLLAGFAAYTNSFNNPFMIDDHAFFDEKLKNIKFMWYQFVPDKEKFLNIESERGDAYYRPFAHIIPMICHLQFKNNVVGYHVVNLLLFWLASVLLYNLLNLLFANQQLSFWASLFYLIHPINNMAVNYITASIYGFQAIVMILSLTGFWLAEHKPKQKWIYLSIGYINFVFSLLCHETSLGLPIYYAFFWYAAGKKSIKESLLKTIPFLIIAAIYFVFRLKYASLGTSILGKFAMFNMSIPEYLASLGHLLYWYLPKFFYPVGIVLIYAHAVIREHVFLWCLFLFLVIAIFLGLIYFSRRNRPAFLGMLWFSLGFIPLTFACLFQPVHGPMLEPHWFIFSSIGFFIFIASFFEEIFKNKSFSFKTFCLSIIAGLWIIITMIYNILWNNEIRYCHYWLKESPGFSAVEFYLAKAYEINKDYPNARVYYNKALQRGYKVYMIHTNLGLIDLLENKDESAKQHFLTSLSYDPKLAVPSSNLGTIYYKQGDYIKAKEYFERSIQDNRFILLPRLNLAATYKKLGMFDKAINTYNEIIWIVPSSELAHINLLKLYMQIKDTKGTIETAKRLLDISNNPESLTNVGIILDYNKLTVEAEIAFQKAIRVYPRYPESYWNYAQLLARQRNTDKAQEIIKEGLRNTNDIRFKKKFIK